LLLYLFERVQKSNKASPIIKGCENMKRRTQSLFLLAALSIWGLGTDANAFRKGSNGTGNERERAEAQIERLRQIMVPLLRVTNQQIPVDELRVSIVDEPAINAASGGNGHYYVTTGLMGQANDNQLRGVLAHEIAHEDLGHPAKAQVIGIGVGLGAALLEKLIPGSSSVSPIAGTLISNNYSRPLELQADRHAVTLLRRAGYSKDTMVDTLAWLMRRNGDTGGGIFASHPATSDRIKALQALR
jgi:predicted Zn-dependent protease